jgi:hypothetical protein
MAGSLVKVGQAYQTGDKVEREATMEQEATRKGPRAHVHPTLAGLQAGRDEVVEAAAASLRR